MYKYIKRAFDFISALLLFVAILPFFGLIALFTLVFNGNPVFFRQERTGMNGRKFDMLKFRTMTDTYDENGRLLPDEMRVTKWGRFLRSSSLDELPELINIIRGDMSVIGPRPLPSRYDRYYTEQEKKRYNVRGGLIPPCNCLAKKTVLTWDEQLGHDAWYAENLSFMLDIRIMFFVFAILFIRSKSDYGSFVREALDVERTKEITITN